VVTYPGDEITISVADTIVPLLLNRYPDDDATSVHVNTNITSTFSEPMDPSTLTAATFELLRGTNSINGQVDYYDATNTATFNPDANLSINTRYSVKVHTGISDQSGNKIAREEVWSFKKDSSSDNEAPVVITTSPADAAADISPNVFISATFSEAMNSATITDESFLLSDGGVHVPVR